MNEIDSKVRRIFSNIFDVPAESLAAHSSPKTIPTWDSLHHMSLIVSLEEEFDIAFDESEIAHLLTFAAALEQVSKKQAKNKSDKP